MSGKLIITHLVSFLICFIYSQELPKQVGSPVLNSFPPSGFTSTYNDKYWFAQYNQTLYRYKFATGDIINSTTVSERYFAAMVVLDNNLYISGGSVFSNSPTPYYDDVLKCNIETLNCTQIQTIVPDLRSFLPDGTLVGTVFNTNGVNYQFNGIDWSPVNLTIESGLMNQRYVLSSTICQVNNIKYTFIVSTIDKNMLIYYNNTIKLYTPFDINSDTNFISYYYNYLSCYKDTLINVMYYFFGSYNMSNSMIYINDYNNIISPPTYIYSGATVNDTIYIFGVNSTYSISVWDYLTFLNPSLLADNKTTTSADTTSSTTTTTSTGSVNDMINLEQANTNSFNMNIIYGIVGGGVGLVVLVALIAIVIARRRRTRHLDLIIPETQLLNNIKVESLIGSGNFSCVFRGVWNGTTQIALKKVTQNDDISEMNILKSLKHPNVVQFFGLYQEEGVNYIVTEYMTHGSLETYIRRHTVTPEKLVSFAKDICSGMAYLESQKIIHRDLALRNVLVSGSDASIIKVSDFGLSKQISEYSNKNSTIANRWAAPESLSSGSFSHRSDVWSFGVTLWELYSGQKPFPNLNNKQVISEVTSGKHLEPEPNWPDSIKLVLMRCFEFNPSDRPDFSQIYRTLSQMAFLGPNTVVIRNEPSNLSLRPTVAEISSRYSNQYNNGFVSDLSNTSTSSTDLRCNLPTTRSDETRSGETRAGETRTDEFTEEQIKTDNNYININMENETDYSNQQSTTDDY